MNSLKWEHEVLLQRFEQVRKERDELYCTSLAAIREVQQKAGVKGIFLERKIIAFQQSLQVKVA